MPFSMRCAGYLSGVALLLVNFSVAIHAAPASGPGTAPGSEDAAEVRELFRMCCWATGRAGFQHCTEYGACKSDPANTCTGRGPAAGLVVDCSRESGGDSDAAFFLLPLAHTDRGHGGKVAPGRTRLPATAGRERIECGFDTGPGQRGVRHGSG